VPARALGLIEQASGRLRPAEVEVTETVLGRVIRLETREIPADLLHPSGAREILVEGTGVQSGTIAVRVRLGAEEYLAAVEAHRAGKGVMVSGRIERTSRGNNLAGARGFRVLG